MTPRRLSATLLLIVGIILLIIAVLSPGERLFVPAGLPSDAHVTALHASNDNSLYAATQNGEIWRYRDRLWTMQRLTQGASQPVITVLTGDPKRQPVGTGTGLVWSGGQPPPGNPHVLDILSDDQGLVLATRKGLWVSANGQWHQPLPTIFGYRLATQQVDGRRWLHLGTIGRGVYSTEATERLDNWQPNRQGIPDEAKVLSFAETAGGRLLAGTDLGLFWQSAPGQAWKSLDGGLTGRRILALYRPSGASESRQRLWVGTDTGLHVLTISEGTAGPTAQEAVEQVAFSRPVSQATASAIAPLGRRLFVSAGTVYELRTVRAESWYFMLLSGAGLMLLGTWLARRSS